LLNLSLNLIDIQVLSSSSKLNFGVRFAGTHTIP